MTLRAKSGSTKNSTPVYLVAAHERLTGDTEQQLRQWGVDADAAATAAGSWIRSLAAPLAELRERPTPGTDSEFQVLLAASHAAVGINGLRTAGAALYVLRNGARGSAAELLATLLVAQGLLGFAKGSTAASTMDQINQHLGWAADDADAELRTWEGLRDMDDEALERERRQASADQGRRGAAKKRERTDRLLDWAKDQARGMRDSPMNIARKLVLVIPSELQNASRDPQTLIYRHLSANTARPPKK